jgi:hypothetical protein
LIRRGAAFGVDLVFLVAVSIPFMFLLTLTLSYINPQKYENPVHQIQDALKAQQSIHMEFRFLIGPKKTEKEENALVLGEGLTWVHEIFVFYLYFVCCFFFGGKTLGKKIWGLQVVKQDGSRLSLWNAFERTHGYVFSASILFLGFFQVFWNKERLTLHDKIADTTVIRIKK